jgi:hypothetical protein
MDSAATLYVAGAWLFVLFITNVALAYGASCMVLLRGVGAGNPHPGWVEAISAYAFPLAALLLLHALLGWAGALSVGAPAWIGWYLLFGRYAGYFRLDFPARDGSVSGGTEVEPGHKQAPGA